MRFARCRQSRARKRGTDRRSCAHTGTTRAKQACLHCRVGARLAGKVRLARPRMPLWVLPQRLVSEARRRRCPDQSNMHIRDSGFRYQQARRSERPVSEG